MIFRIYIYYLYYIYYFFFYLYIFLFFLIFRFYSIFFSLFPFKIKIEFRGYYVGRISLGQFKYIFRTLYKVLLYIFIYSFSLERN